jgi:hypothetical protein
VGDNNGAADGGESPVLSASESAVVRARLDDFDEVQCAEFYAEAMGRPSLPPGIYFRLLLIG